LNAGAAEVQATLALPGFTDFLRDFDDAVSSQDAQWFINHTHFETAACPSFLGSNVTPPPLCSGIAPPPEGPVIMVGVWNGEGSAITDDDYIESLQSGSIDGGQMYAIGKQKNDLGLGDSEVGVVVLFPAAPVTPGEQSVRNFRVAVVNGDWRITGQIGGFAKWVPDAFRWYATWDVIESAIR
jgi:hypothetical protein